MAKRAISVTLDDNVISNLRLLAIEENRSVSNLTELILKSYMEIRSKDMSVTQSFEKAKNFSNEMQIKSYGEVVENLKNNVTISEKDKEFLEELRKK
jgi:hypothetical protein